MEENEQEVKKYLNELTKNIYMEVLNPGKTKQKKEIVKLKRINQIKESLNMEETPIDIRINEQKDYDLKRKNDLYLTAFLQKYRPYFQEITKSFFEALNFYDFNYVFMKPKDSVNDDTAKEIIYEFYNSLGSAKGNIAYNMIKNKRIIREEPNSKTGYNGYCVYIYGEKYPFIVTQYNRNRLDLKSLSTIVHELAHSIEFVYSQNRCVKDYFAKDYMTTEIVSIFYEHLFQDFIEKNYLFQKDLINTSTLDLYYKACSFKSVYTLFSDTFEHALGEISYVDNTCIVNGNQIYAKYKDDLIVYNLEFDIDIINDLKYVIGQVFTYNLLDLYEKDPEKFNIMFDNFLSCRSLLTLDESLKFLRIDKEEFTSMKNSRKRIINSVKRYNDFLYHKKI